MDLLTRSNSNSGSRTPAHESHAAATPASTAASSPTSSSAVRPSQRKASPLSAPVSGYASGAESSDVEGSGLTAVKAQRNGSRFAVPSFMRRASATMADAAVDSGAEGAKTTSRGEKI